MLSERDKEWLRKEVADKLETACTVKLRRVTLSCSAEVELEASGVDVKLMGEQAMALLVEMECNTCRDERREIQ